MLRIGLGQLRDLAVSRYATVLKDVPEDVWKLVGTIVQRW
jgi:hypothetical protein